MNIKFNDIVRVCFKDLCDVSYEFVGYFVDCDKKEKYINEKRCSGIFRNGFFAQ